MKKYNKQLKNYSFMISRYFTHKLVHKMPSDRGYPHKCTMRKYSLFSGISKILKSKKKKKKHEIQKTNRRALAI